MVKIRRIEEARDIGGDRWEGMDLEQRVLLHTDELMVVWLKIPPGTEFPDHSHHHAQIGCRVSGRAELWGRTGSSR
jgi:quercetin dioxygenase-like cupin family protein